MPDRIYQNLKELKAAFPKEFKELDTALSNTFQKAEEQLFELFDEGNKRRKDAVSVLFYLSDLALPHVQLFLQTQEEKDMEDWNFLGAIYRGKEVAEIQTIDKMVDTYLAFVEEKLTYSDDTVLHHFESTEQWIEIGADNHIYQEEMLPYLAEFFAQELGLAFKKYSEEKAFPQNYLDFFPEKEFHHSQFYDLTHGKWIPYA